MNQLIQSRLNEGFRRRNPIAPASKPCAACPAFFWPDGSGSDRCEQCRRLGRAARRQEAQRAFIKRNMRDTLRDEVIAMYKAGTLPERAKVSESLGKHAWQVVVVLDGQSYTFYKK